MHQSPLLPVFADFGASLFSTQPTPPPIHRVEGRGARQIAKPLKLACPNVPGVYGMLNREGQLIYVGKAKRLRVRLMSYCRTRGRPPKAGRIIRQTAAIVWERWPHEFSASLRELELIRRWRPDYNVQGQPLRRQLTYVCLGGSPVPYFFLSRKPPLHCEALEGPISLQSRTRDAVQLLNNAYRLRDCPQKQTFVFADDKELFPGDKTPGCLRYEIGNCLGPCAALCTRKQYRRETRGAKAFLLGESVAPIETLRKRIGEASQVQQYEQAQMLQNRLILLEWLADRLNAVRISRRRMSFVYRLVDGKGNATWHLIHGARAVNAIAEPKSRDEKKQARQLLQSIYTKRTDANLMQSYEHLDGMSLVSSWFQRNPDEKKRTLAPDDALALCKK